MRAPSAMTTLLFAAFLPDELPRAIQFVTMPFVIVNETDVHLAHILYVRFVLDLKRAHRSSDREQTACKEPFGKVVVIAQPPESSR